MTDWLTVNAGSTSVKIGRRRGGVDLPVPADLEDALAGPPPDAVVHRVVHGGTRTGAVRLDDGVVHDLHALTELAPLHQPPALDAVRRCRERWPEVPQVACFDTAFHTSMPAAATTYALPADLRAQIRVYGFHGLAHAWAAARAREAAPHARRVLVAHLGGGQSLCGVLEGRSVVTTMGFTPLDGLVMATRSGTVDPGAVLHLVRRGASADALDDAFERRGGLLGLAGTPDMREVLARRRAGDPAATLAVDVWLHRFLRQAGGCIAVLGGLDLLVFSGGVGENSAELRAEVTERLAWLGTVPTLVVAAREDLQMIAEAAGLLRLQTA